MKRKSVLIIPGYGIDCAAATAAILLKYPDAVVRASSKRRLPEMLEGLLSKDEQFNEVIITGVSLAADPERLMNILKRLKGRDFHIAWLSVFPLPDWFPKEICELLEFKIEKDIRRICRAALMHYVEDISEKTAQTLLRISENSIKKLSVEDLARVKLLDASMFNYRNFQDETVYPSAIRALSRNAPLNDKQIKMISEYEKYGTRELKGVSKSVESLWEITKKLGKSSCSVIITGETGTGKETVANLIHLSSERRIEPFIAFNCADLSPQLIESRLFGHEKGAFTGAFVLRQGAFEKADGGTLFLDEVAELSPDIQAGLLRVLQEKRFFRLGGKEEVSVDVRIIAATNKNLVEMMRKGTFREDLFYRLAGVVVNIPPLRERLEDIEPIANHYLLRKGVCKLTVEQKKALLDYHWPGNVRELINILERAYALGEMDFSIIIREHKAFMAHCAPDESDLLDDSIKRHIKIVLEKCDGNQTRAMSVLGISRNTLKKYLK